MLRGVARGWLGALALGAPAALGGCSTMQELAGVPRTGHQPDGTYVVSPEDEALACRQIRERLDTLSAKIKQLPAKAAEEEQSTPRTVGAALGRMFGGPGAGLESTQDFQRATAESEALNALLVKKRCA